VTQKPLKLNEAEKHCPICGVVIRRGHRCNPRTLAAIDAAMRTDRIDQSGIPRNEAERICYGFSLLALDQEDIEDAADDSLDPI
jgi:hypothetical protein